MIAVFSRRWWSEVLTRPAFFETNSRTIFQANQVIFITDKNEKMPGTPG